MKISKLLLVGVLASALCMVVPTTADVIPPGADTNILVGSIGRPALAYHDGDVISYTAIVSVPAADGISSPCRQENVDVSVTLPDGTVVNFGTIPFLDPGDSVTFDATDNALMDYTIDHLDEDISHRVTATLNAVSEIAHVAEDDLDNATLFRDIGTTVLHPGIQILKQADPTAICEGVETEITYSYQVSWAPGANGILHDVTALDDTCGPLVRQLDNPGDNDALLETGEIWEYECTTTISGETTNTVEVSGFDAGDVEVTDTDEATVIANPPPEVVVDPEVAVICELNEVELCAVITPETGTPPFTYEWSKDGVVIPDSDVECIVVSEAGTYCVTVTDDAGCEATACGTVRVIEQPDCSIDSGPTSLCDDQIGVPQEYCTLVEADNYEWEVISGPADPIAPEDNGLPCVSITPTGLGTIVLELRISNDVPDDGVCENSCQIEIVVEECGNTFCSFTQGFWGNAGGKGCGGMTTSELIQLALDNNGGPITLGLPGNSITFDSVECILASLPAGGTPACLPDGDWTCANLSSFYKNKKKTELNNVLIGQALALQLNLLVSDGCVEEAGNLGDWVLPAEFCVVPYWNPEACPKHYTIPESLVGKTVQELLDAVNAALGCEGDINAAYAGATAINEGFDECATVVSCPTEEICDNGCDDDFDGLIDLDDPDCQPE